MSQRRNIDPEALEFRAEVLRQLRAIAEELRAIREGQELAQEAAELSRSRRRTVDEANGLLRRMTGAVAAEGSALPRAR